MTTRMAIHCNRTAMVVGVLLSLAGFSTVAVSADTMLGTGGYNRELHTMEMMKMLDANSDHMVSNEEFTTYYGSLFDELDKNRDGAIDSKEWVGTKSDNKVSIATGGYSQQLRKMEMMKTMDTDKDHKVTKDEFIKFHDSVFTAMDTKGEKMIDAESWLRKTTGN
jgi:Ca2+-binding EF-hand superfamily protein